MTTLNITVETDADFYQVFQYTLPDGITPIDVSGASFTFGVRRSLADLGVLFYVTSTFGVAGQIQVINGPQGNFGLWIAKAQIQAAPIGIWSQSMVMTVQAQPGAFPPTITTPIWGGTLSVVQGAAR